MPYGNDLCTGGTPSASSEYDGSYVVLNAVDDTVTTYWVSGSTPTPHWYKYDFGAGNAHVVTQYTIQVMAGGQNPPRQWIFQGSNNDADWTDLDTQASDVIFDAGEKKTFNSFVNTTAYRYVRLYITSAPSGYAAMDEFEVMESAGSVQSDIPVTPLIITAHAPSYFIPVAFIPVMALRLTAHAPTTDPLISNVPVAPMVLSAPQNAETGRVVTLLNFNDTPGEEVVTDETGRIWNVPHVVDPPSHNAEASADGPLVGMGSLSLQNTLAHIETEYTPDLDIVSREFTFECWHKTAAGSMDSATADFWMNNGELPDFDTGFQIDGGYQGYVSARLSFGLVDYVDPEYDIGDPDYVYLDHIQPLRTEWKHFAIARRGNSVYGFDHGVLTVTKTINPLSRGILHAPTAGIKIGGVWFVGNISGVKLTVGEGKWISDFTPPSTPSEYIAPFRTYARSNAPSAGITLSSHDPTWLFRMSSRPPVLALVLTVKNPSAVWDIIASMRPAAQVIYYCILTGANESPALPDLLIPISSFQARIRNGEPSYLSCVIPNPTDYVDGITARSSGEIIIQKGYRLLDGSINMSEIVRVDYETLAIDQGARSASGTIVGHKTVTATAAKEWTVDGVSFYGLQHDGKRRFRASMDLFLRPGDVAIYGSGDDDSFIVGQITYIVSTRDGLMEVTEA